VLPDISSVAWTENRPVIVVNGGTRYVLGWLVENGDKRADAASELMNQPEMLVTATVRCGDDKW